MDTLLLQDWVTINGQTSTFSATQTSDSWLDVSAYEDLVFYLDVKQSSGSPSLSYQTAPSRQESSFRPLVPVFTLATGLRVDRVFFGNSFVVPAHFVRWVISGGTICSVTFRCWVAAYSLE